jgi:polyribonucleotide nucleotidyltransferase
MQETITHPKREISKYAPIFETIKIQNDDIKKIIGIGGKIIKEICGILRHNFDKNTWPNMAKQRNMCCFE